MTRIENEGIDYDPAGLRKDNMPRRIEKESGFRSNPPENTLYAVLRSPQRQRLFKEYRSM